MKTKIFKKTLLAVLSVSALACMGVSVTVSASAAEETKPIVSENLYAQGAKVQVKKDGSAFYITFDSYLTDSLVDWMSEDSQESAKVGVLIGPATLYTAEDTYDSLIADTFEDVYYLGNAASKLQLVSDLAQTDGKAKFESSVRFALDALAEKGANGSYDADKNGKIDETELDAMIKALTKVELVAVPYMHTATGGYELGAVKSGARSAKQMLNNAAVCASIDTVKYADLLATFVGTTTEDKTEYVVDSEGAIWKADENGNLVVDSTTEFVAYAGRGVDGALEIDNLKVGTTYALVREDNGELVNAKAKYVTKVLANYDDFKTFAYTSEQITYKSGSSTAIASVNVEKDGYYVMANDVDMASERIDIANGLTIGAAANSISTTTGGFIGTFDGRGKIINNFQAGFGGLFTVLRGTVKNVAFNNAVLKNNQGGLLGLGVNNATVENVFISVGTVTNSNVGHVAYGFAYKLDNTTFNNVIVYGADIVSSGSGYINRFMDFSYYNDGATNSYTNYYSIGQGQFGYLKKDATTYYTLWDETNGATVDIATSGLPYIQQIKTYFYKDGEGVTKLESFNNGAKKFDTYANMGAANLNLSSFKASGCWDIYGGVPVWKNLPMDLKITDEEGGESFTLTDSITFKAQYKAFNEDAYTQAKVTAVNVKDGASYVTVKDATLSKSNTVVKNPVTVTVEVVTTVGTKTVYITINPVTTLLNTDHEIYIQEDGTVVGLTENDLTVVGGYDLFDGSTQLTYADSALSGLTGKTVGQEYSFTATSDDSNVVYEVKYLYVTKAIEDEAGLAAMKCEVTDSKPSSLVEGYFVLANDISCSGTGFGYSLDGKDFRTSEYGFAGTFDGRGHTVSNFYAYRGGLFLHVNGGTIKNVAFTNCKLNFKQDGVFALTAKNMTVQDVYVQIIPAKKGSTNYMASATVWQHTGCTFTRVVVENNSVYLAGSDTTEYQNVASFGVNVDLTKTTFTDCISIGRGLFISNDSSATTSLSTVVDKAWATASNSTSVTIEEITKTVTAGTGTYALENLSLKTWLQALTTRPNAYFLDVEGATHYGTYTSMYQDTVYDYADFATSGFWTYDEATNALTWGSAS